MVHLIITDLEVFRLLDDPFTQVFPHFNLTSALANFLLSNTNSYLIFYVCGLYIYVVLSILTVFAASFVSRIVYARHARVSYSYLDVSGRFLSRIHQSCSGPRFIHRTRSCTTCPPSRRRIVLWLSKRSGVLVLSSAIVRFGKFCCRLLLYGSVFDIGSRWAIEVTR